MRNILEMKDKRGQIGTLQGIVLSLVIIGVLIGAAFLVMGEFEQEVENTSGNGSKAYENIGKVIDAMGKVPQFLGLVVLIAVISVIVALIFNAFPGARTST
jgi:hypothetical protein